MPVVRVGKVEPAGRVDRQVVGLVVLALPLPDEDALRLGLHVEGDDAERGPLADDQLAEGIEHHAVGIQAVIDEHFHRPSGPPEVNRVVLAV